MKVGQEIIRANFKLVDEKTGAEIQLPAMRASWSGSEHLLEEFKPSKYVGSEGLVRTSLNEGFVASVFGLRVVEIEK